MIIHALNKNFDVIHIREVNVEYRVLYCKTLEERESYTILHFRKKEMIKALLPLFYSLQENKAYEDYAGCFSQEEELYAVFYKRKGISLPEQLADQSLSLEQRMLIGKRVLEKFLLWKLPDFLICQLLDTNRILLRGEEVGFSYDWNLAMDEQPDITTVNRRMVQFLENLFQKEIEYAISPRLIDLLDDLKQDIPKDFFAIYEEYNSLHDIIPQEAKEYQTSFNKMKQKIHALIIKSSDLIKMILFAAAYVAAILIMVNVIKGAEAEKEEPEGVIYETIGTLRIK